MRRTLLRSIYLFRHLQARNNVMRSLSRDERTELEDLERQLRVPAGVDGDVEERREFLRFDTFACEVEVQIGATWHRGVLVDVGGGGFAIDAIDGVGRGSLLRL